MPAGMQCWDANGKLVVDIGDYNCRLFGAVNVSFPTNTAVITVSNSSLKANGSFGVVVATTDGGGVFTLSRFAVRTYDGGFRIFCTSPANSAATLTVNLYGFL